MYYGRQKRCEIIDIGERPEKPKVMQMEYLDKLLEKLTLATGVGYSGNIKDVILQELQEYHVEARIEQDGSVYGCLKGQKDIGIMIACHIDEVGFMVNSIDDAGRISISGIGGVDVRILPGQEVIVRGKKELKGYIGAKPPHLTTREERKKVLPIEKLFVDTGLIPREVKKLVKIGDCISFLGTYKKLQGNLRSVKALDNRASIACGLLVLKELLQMERLYSLYFVATSQEEYTGLGARIHSYKLPIHYAIVVDVSHAEHPDLKDYECFPLNSGPVISRGAVIPEKLSDLLIEAAKEMEISFQIEPLPTRTGTDADDIAFNREGIPTCVVGIPLRYMHTPVEVVSLKDIDRTKRLIINFVKRLEKSKK
ncbi:M20/M25/M40 family metallo-hydrolase [candidate division WOR-3 bacterium]|nr:M20/M25/M40 family metallo-hydrolase [candidate division WOR-3 bacterium]